MLLDGYEVGERLAESDRNTVRRVRRIRDGARFVIKTSTREYPSVRDVRRLEFEFRILRRVQSRGVIAAVDIERSGGRVALVLEDFGGERLTARAQPPLELEAFFPIASSIVQALAHVHACGVMHRDINPGNVLINRRTSEIKLIDFSIASELSREQLDAAPQASLEGTLPYLSPEQTGRMNRELDYRTDYYSLGVTLFELLTGGLPFEAEDVLGYIHCHLSKPAPDPRERTPGVPEGLARIVTKLLAKSPDDRYQSARGLSLDLESCQQSWKASGTVRAFALGQQDVSERFSVSRALLGRAAETQQLLAAFERAASGPAQLLLVSGYSGIGKSTLIAEIHKPLVEKRAHFASGKFELLERNTPYVGLLRALRALCRQLLSEPERQLAQRRERLRAALGNDAAVLFPLLPELSQILGPQPTVAELGGREAQARQQRLFRAFLRATASAEQPLVLFLDDLQWVDGATPQLLAHLLGEGQLRHVYIIAAYRDNEVGPHHPLQRGLAELRAKRPELVHELRLQPLTLENVQEMVATTLRCAPGDCESFARRLFQKTGGNPFFIHELLRSLHRQGAIEFSRERGSWSWKEQALEDTALSDNVVELVLGRLRALPADTLDSLSTAACLGKEFNLGLLARVLDKTPGAVAAALWPACERELCLPTGDAHRLVRRDPGDGALELDERSLVYRFPHDRVVEAAAALLDEGQRSLVHLRIGRELRARIPEAEQAERVFEFIDHLNRGRALLSTAAERAALSELNYAAACKARASAAYAAAIAHLDCADELLDDEQRASRQSHVFACRRAWVENVFLSGQVERARTACAQLLELAPDTVSRVSVYCLQAAICEQQSQLSEAVEIIRSGLAELGIALPTDAEEINQAIGAGIGKLQGHLERVAIEALPQLPELNDPERIATTELLFQLIPPASQLNPPLFILAELILFDLASSHGTVPGSAKNFMDCGIVFSAILADYGRAYRMGRAAFQLLERRLPTTLESAVNFVFGCFISHWGAHFSEGLAALERGHQRGVELGDVLHASYSIVHHAKSMFFAGKPLAECAAATERALAYTLETGAVGHSALPRSLRRAVEQLTEANHDGADAQLSDQEFTREIEATQNGHFLLVLGQCQALTHLILGDLARASAWDELATRHLSVGNGAFPIPDYYLVRALLLARKWSSAGPEERAQIARTLEQHEAQLEVFGEASPANYQHKVLLVRAEQARLSGASIDEVLRLHREAAQAMGEDFTHLRALAQESLAELWQERGHPEFARECLLEAYHLYRHWGARAKLSQMTQAHGKWLHSDARGKPTAPGATLSTATATASVAGTELDVASVLKATLAISSEVKSSRLFAVLMKTIIENVGADHGHLIVAGATPQQLLVAAHASIDAEAEGGLQLPLERCTTLSREMVRFVARTQETLVLDDARSDETYQRDPHVISAGVRSALCLPILSQGRLLAILYAENRAVAHAFTHARLLFLRVLAGQAAVSIANANSYDRLELEVAKRTLELSERSREVGAMLNSLEQGVFVIDERLHIQPRYSAHLPELLGTHDIAGRDCLELLFRGSSLEPAVVDRVRAALSFCFGVPPLFAQANRAHWLREFQRNLDEPGHARSFEVDWTLIADDEDKVVRILVALRDVTLTRQITAKAARDARELDYVGQILDAGVEPFRRFCSAVQPLLAEEERLIAGPADVAEQARERIFRGLHTIKGNARLLGFQQLANTVHVAEESFDPQWGARARDQMAAALATVRSSLADYERVYQAKLASALGEPLHGDEQTWQAIRARLGEAQTGELEPSQALAAIDQLVQRAGSVPLARVIAQAARLLSVLAQELDKPAPALSVSEPGLLLNGAWSRAVLDCLVHVFQNALSHGIESAAERAARNQPPQGTIRVHARRSARGVTLCIADDGRGLPLAALRQRSGNPQESDAEAALRIFDAGVSTATRLSESAGRGMGLDAVRAQLRELGGDAMVTLGPEMAPGFRRFELLLELPAEATWAAGS
ncbi:MAG: hypothetical protein RL033_4799 [Pseudomonadota bacterium]